MLKHRVFAFVVIAATAVASFGGGFFGDLLCGFRW